MRLSQIVTMSGVVVVFGVATVLAQAPAQPAPPPAHMTITGCLRAGPNPSGVPDTTTYTLEPVEIAPTPPAGAATTPVAKPPSRYTLTAGPSVQLKLHVGHKVELSGHLKDLSAPTAATRPDPERMAKPPQPGGAHNTFEVTSLKMIAPACP
jgi:hypothetical protein